MSPLIAIRLKALFLLTIFAANLYAVCHCRQMASTRHTLSRLSHKDSCCHEDCRTAKTDADHPKPCNEKDGCSGTHAVKFNLMEKQAAKPFHIHPLFSVVFTHHFILPTDVSFTSGNPRGSIGKEWLYKHSPHDLQSLYQRFLI